MPLFRKGIRPDNTALSIKELNPYIGVILENIYDITQLRKPAFDVIKQLVLDYGVVVIKGKRKWSEQEQKEFTNGLGKLELPVVYSIPPSQVAVKTEDSRVKKGSGVFWHSDNSYQKRPSHLSVFQMIEIPESGTATSFSSLVNLSANLPAQNKSLWRDYSVLYRDNVEHPLQWQHPFTGKDTIYFDIGFSTDIIDHCNNRTVLPVKESNEIFNYINERLSKEESLIEHQWQDGDIVVLDNYSVAHRADILLENEKRVLLRMTTKGVYF